MEVGTGAPKLVNLVLKTAVFDGFPAVFERQWRKILSVYTKKSLAAEAPPRTPGDLTTLPHISKSDPRRLAPVSLTPYDSRLRHSSRIAVTKLWSRYIGDNIYDEAEI